MATTEATPNPNDRFCDSRNQAVDRDIVGRAITDELVLKAMRSVPREAFVPKRAVEQAYEDHPLPIGKGQTISQPFIVALMAASAELNSDSRVLEVGAGSGYGAAVLGRIAGEVWSIERHAGLAEGAADRLAALGFDNVHVIHGDGTLGFPQAAPFDAIVVTAGAPEVPEALLEQLTDDGRLVIPVGPDAHRQRLRLIRKTENGFVETDLSAVRFVPLVQGPAR